MKRFAAGLLLGACLNAAAEPGSAIAEPVYQPGAAACGAADTSITFSPDHSAISLLRRGDFLQAQGKGVATARCRIGRRVVRPFPGAASLDGSAPAVQARPPVALVS